MVLAIYVFYVNIFKKSFYKDRSDAIEFAKERKKIKLENEKQLPLTGTEWFLRTY